MERDARMALQLPAGVGSALLATALGALAPIVVRAQRLPLDDAGRDAAAHEIQDLCDGHPQGNSQYHYHSGSPCIPGAESDSLVGWTLDGHPIFGMKGGDGRTLANADLDACHGHREDVRVDGHAYSYVYHLTREYPYTLGCFTGQLLASTLKDVRDGLAPRRRPRHW